MKPLPAACLFDLDGLLLDTEPLHGRGWSDAATHFGGQLTHSQLLQLKGRRRQDCALQVDAWLPSPVGTEALLAIQQPIVRSLLPDAPAMPGAQALVEHLGAANIPMAMVTSSSREAVLFKSKPHAWLEHISHRVYGDDPELTEGKPNPAPFELAAQRLGVNTHECWAFEDSKAGCQSALRAGCQVWLLRPDEQPSQSFFENPCRIATLESVLSLVISTSG